MSAGTVMELLSDPRTWALLVFIAMLVALVAFKQRPPLVFGAGVLVYYALGLLDMDDLLLHLTNPALITLMLLLMASLVLEKTVLVHRLAERLIGKGFSHSLARLSLLTLGFSALLNNTAVVATLMNRIASNPYHPPSKLLIPLSYCAILGGTLTLVGTSTNLIVAGFVLDTDMAPLELLDFAPVGLPTALVCAAAICFLAARLLPDRGINQVDERDFLLEARLRPDSPLVGKTVEENGLRRLDRLFLAEVVRGDELISPVRPTTRLQEGDQLLFSGDINDVSQIEGFPGLVLNDHHTGVARTNMVEAVLSHTSSLAGKTVKEAAFRGRFDAALLAVCRGAEKLSGRIGDIRLKAGDCLFLATGPDFEQRHPELHMHLVEGEFKRPALKRGASGGALAGFGACLVLGGAGIMPLMDALILLLAFYLWRGWLTPTEIRQRFPVGLFLTIGFALTIATVWLHSGMIDAALGAVSPWLNGGSAVTGLIMIYLLTWLMTELVTNNVAAALVFPLGYATAGYYGAEPMAFTLAVAFGASASFLTPLGYQTNLMVYSAGGYRFTDFLRLGVPVSLLYGACVLTLIPLLYL
ncbi:SLC13 family permease [Motiliproteus sp. SC1-56]|uniref:SLC13 family permease n=1 Tax=Motiliproteus sp. SC1-56 TaxID=2799565 RepID=UPI001A8DFEC0|nr:SLC13 family permease [Motiliproteus sp. SC1-56]